MNSEEPIENEKIRFNKLKKFIWISYGKYVIICLLIEKTKKKGSISYAKWGYIFIAPFFIIFAVFQLIPLVSTIYYSFFEYYRSGLKIIGPSFVGLKNYITLFATDLPKYFSNTLILWIIGFVPRRSSTCPT